MEVTSNSRSNLHDRLPVIDLTTLRFWSQKQALWKMYPKGFWRCERRRFAKRQRSKKKTSSEWSSDYEYKYHGCLDSIMTYYFLQQVNRPSWFANWGKPIATNLARQLTPHGEEGSQYISKTQRRARNYRCPSYISNTMSDNNWIVEVHLFSDHRRKRQLVLLSKRHNLKNVQ